MALIHTENKDEVKEEFDEIDEYLEENDTDSKARGIAGWGISLSLHAIMILLVSMVYFAKQMIEDKPPIQVVQIDIPPPPPDKTEERALVERPKISNVEHDKNIKDEMTVIVPDMAIDDTMEREDVTDDNSVNGREEAKAFSEAGGQGFAMVMGVGGGGSGAWGWRKPGGDKTKMRSKYGPKNASGATSAIDAALRWLQKHQSENGSWDSDNYFTNCKDGNQCEPGKNVNGADEAMTGYSLLCFLGAGYTHKQMSRYRNSIKTGISWLLAVQKPDGLIGNRNYEHPICTMALAEAYGMTNDPELKEPLEKAVNIIISRQVKDPNAADQAYAGLAWDYVNANPNRMDSSVSGWNCLCLKSAKAAGIDTKGALDGTKVWVEKAWKAANPGYEKLDPYGKSVFPYTWSVDGKVAKDHLSFVGSLCAVFLGYKPGDIILDTMMNDMTERWLVGGKYKTNSYALYYASLSAFMYNGEHWKKWADEETGYVKWVVETQHKTADCLDGSWPFEKQSYHGGDTSRILNHCYYTLALEVAFRYLPISTK